MDKEKEIKEFEQDILNARGNSIVFCGNFPDDCDDYYIDPRSEAEILYDNGYRKADEARKETAKDIADWLEFRYNHGDYFNFLLTIAQTIRKNYGIEVDE